MVLIMSNWLLRVYTQSTRQDESFLVMVPTVIPSPTEMPLRSVLLEVPFTSQAPSGEWGDKRYQDGCEETSVIMVYCALFSDECRTFEGKLDKEFAKSEIENMASWEKYKYGNFVDTSAQDTAIRLLDEYYGIKNYQIKQVNSWVDIARELNMGNFVITPMNGQKLDNPNFTGMGPERHMVLVRGVNMDKKEFITNDPGTRKGEMYRYSVDDFFLAIRDYATGDHEEILGIDRKMIVINGVR